MSPVLQHLLRARRRRRWRRYRRNTASRHRAAKVRNPRSPRKTMSIASSPKRCVGATGAGITAAGTVATTGVGAGVTGAGVAAGTMAGAGVIGVGIAAAGTVAAAIGVAAIGKAVPRLRCRRTVTYLARNASISSLNFEGASRNTRCPAFGMTSARASGILAASALASSAFWPIFGRSAAGAFGLPGAL